MFITLALEPRRPLFGRVDHERVELSAQGEMAASEIRAAEAHFGGFIALRQCAVMPDHIHLRITWPAGRSDAMALIGRFVGRVKQMIHWRIAGRAKSIWGANYHDIICASEKANRTVDAYIRNNPIKWWLMHCDKSLMHVMEPFHLPADAGADDLWRAVGEPALLDSPRLVSLRISQKNRESDIPRIVEWCVRGAREKGYVYISTFFSPGERAVFRQLSAIPGIPMIRMAPTYMDFAYRPHGEEPILFAEKRLLVLSRMPEPDAKPSRSELLGLNEIAASLARGADEGRVIYLRPYPSRP